jgi:hypothetical protein
MSYLGKLFSGLKSFDIAQNLSLG